MSLPHKLLVGVLALATAVTLSAQSITNATADYDSADGLVAWSFTLDEVTSTVTVTHLVLGFNDGGAGAPAVFWNDVSSVTVNSNTHQVTKVDVWPDGTAGTSYLQLNFNTPLTLVGSSTTYAFNYLTGGTMNLNNPTTFFASLYSGGPATQGTLLQGSLVVTAIFSTSPANLTAVPEPATYALLVGLALFGVVTMRRKC